MPHHLNDRDRHPPHIPLRGVSKLHFFPSLGRLTLFPFMLGVPMAFFAFMLGVPLLTLCLLLLGEPMILFPFIESALVVL